MNWFIESILGIAFTIGLLMICIEDTMHRSSKERSKFNPPCDWDIAS